jgi:hypothetical protein
MSSLPNPLRVEEIPGGSRQEEQIERDSVETDENILPGNVGGRAFLQC